MNKKPYVVSGDIFLLMQEWAEQQGFVLPNHMFFQQLREDFSELMSQVFQDFEFVPEEELVNGLTDLVEKSDLFPISLDRVYYRSKPSLELTRAVECDGKDLGLRSRAGAPTMLIQFNELRKVEQKEIVLVDDVIFTGDLLEKVIHSLKKMGIRVPLVCTGVGIAEGIRRLDSLSCKVHSVRTYGKVIDEICERDFYPGVPLSGRLLAGKEDVGVPYILPFGNPGKWASIPHEWQKVISRFCIQQTIKLFEEIERCSNKIVYCKDLQRKVVSLPIDKTRYVEALQKVLW